MFGLVLPSELKGPFSSPFELFPEELWRLIFKELKDPQDLLNMMHSTDEWYEMLAKERTIFLFPKVLEIVESRELLSEEVEDLELAERREELRKQRKEYFEGTNNMVVKRGGRTGRRRRTNSEIEEEERKRLKSEEDYRDCVLNRKPFPAAIFQCRLVCKSWDRAIQNFLQSHSTHYSMLPDNYDLDAEANDNPVGIDRLNFQCEFGEKNDVDKFLQHFQATHPSSRNPFLLRQVVINQICRPELLLEFYNAITNFLEKYGSHVHHLLIEDRCRDFDFGNRIPPATFYSLFRQWLQLTPNLKTLALNLDNSFDHEVNPDPDPQPVVLLAGQIELAPLPKLDQLVLLRTVNVPAAICQHLLQRNGHIKQLQNCLENARGYPNYDTYFRQVTFTNLSELWIELNSRMELVQLATTLTGCRWPLKTLHVNGFNEDSYQEWPEWRRLFNVVEQAFGETLTHLWMHLPNPGRYVDKKTILRNGFNMRLNLPCLKQLRIRIPCLASVDFLLPLNNSLEELSMIVLRKSMSAYYKSKEKIKFNGMLDRMEESNIWEKLPKLRLLEVIILNDGDDADEEEWSDILGRESIKYLYQKSPRSGNVSKIKVDWSEFQWNVIFSQSQPFKRFVLQHFRQFLFNINLFL